MSPFNQIQMSPLTYWGDHGRGGSDEFEGSGLRTPDAACKVYVLDGRYRNVQAFVPARFQGQWTGRVVFLEGGRREVTLFKIERDPSVRKAALGRYGLKCMGCGFVPKAVSQLDVHHMNALAKGGQRLTDLGDVAVLCANCHRLAHSVEPPIALSLLQNLANA